MKVIPLRLILSMALLLLAAGAHAVIVCTVSSPGFAMMYDPVAVAAATTSSSVTISCTRTLADATTQTYQLSASNGLQATGQTNQAKSAAAGLIKYNEYQDAAYTKVWGPSLPKSFSGTINFGTATTATVNLPFYVSVPAKQAAAAADYFDTVTMTLTYGAATATGTHSVLISTLPQCMITTAPGNVMLSYTSFQATAAVASTTFATTCTTALPYTMALDAISGTINGVNYTVALSAASSTGTGAVQTYSINGSAVAGQSGTCTTATCTGADVRILTITF